MPAQSLSAFRAGALVLARVAAVVLARVVPLSLLVPLQLLLLVPPSSIHFPNPLLHPNSPTPRRCNLQRRFSLTSYLRVRRLRESLHPRVVR